MQVKKVTTGGAAWRKAEWKVMLQDSGLQDCRAPCEYNLKASVVQGCILRGGRAVELRAEGMRSAGLPAGGRRVEVCREAGLRTAEQLQGREARAGGLRVGAAGWRAAGWRAKGRGLSAD